MFEIQVRQKDNFYITIKNLHIQQFQRDIKRKWGTSKLYNLYTGKMFGWSRYRSIDIHKFFLPELVYILNQLPQRKMYKNLKTLLLENTWLKSTTFDYPSRVNINRLKELKRTLKDYQLNFLDLYDRNMQRYNLKGYLNAFEPGLGKTITSIALMHCLSKDKVVVVAPNNTIYDTWVKEINDTFQQEQKIWTQRTPISNAKWYLINYESMNKLLSINDLTKGNIGIIIDEIHHFRNTKTLRSENAFQIADMTKSTDVLCMSGTPIKALGSEMIPLLKLIDPLFDDTVSQIFKDTFGVSSTVLTDIISNRLHLVMHRKTKEEVLTLPEKTEEVIKVSIPDGESYTLPKVKELVQKFVSERSKYYQQNGKMYIDQYLEIMAYFEANCKYDKKELENYKYLAKRLRTNNPRFHTFKEKSEVIEICNTYEKKVIIPQLPPPMRKIFRKAKSVYKYVEFVIMGEVLGGLLPQLRANCYKSIIVQPVVKDIIQGAIKKTIVFTTYGQVVEHALSIYKKDWKLTPIPIYQKTSSQRDSFIKEFRSNPKANPLITTIQMMSTGVTLNEANTVIFAPTPFRYVDYEQAYNRCYRIGQSDPVFIYTLVLDTGETPNISTRIQEISDWSKELFEKIVGGSISDENTEDELQSTLESLSTGILSLEHFNF